MSSVMAAPRDDDFDSDPFSLAPSSSSAVVSPGGAAPRAAPRGLPRGSVAISILDDEPVIDFDDEFDVTDVFGGNTANWSSAAWQTPGVKGTVVLNPTFSMDQHNIDDTDSFEGFGDPPDTTSGTVVAQGTDSPTDNSAEKKSAEDKGKADSAEKKSAEATGKADRVGAKGEPQKYDYAAVFVSDATGLLVPLSALPMAVTPRDE
jgi:hypothetical protein